MFELQYILLILFVLILFLVQVDWKADSRLALK